MADVVQRVRSVHLPNSLRFDGQGNNWVPSDNGHRDTALNVDFGPAKVKRWRLWLLTLFSSIVAATVTFLCSAAGTALLRVVTEFHPFNDAFADEIFRLVIQSTFALMSYLGAIGLTVHTGRQLGQFIGGSGIPELKCELGGVHLMGLFDHRVLLGKLLGLSLAIGSGLPVGCEGPFVHASGCINHLMMCTFPVFHGILDSRKLRHMAISSMVAVGVACTFTAPLGGVLYALEVTDSFHASNYVPCFFGATIAGIVNMGLRSLMPRYAPQPLFETDVTEGTTLTSTENFFMQVLFIVFGALCGVLGACFVQAHRLAMGWISKLATSKSEIPAPDVVLTSSGADDESDTVGEMTGSTSVRRRRFVSAASFPPESPARDPSASPGSSGSAETTVKLRKRKLYFAIIVAVVGAINAAICMSVPVLQTYPTQPRLLNALVSKGDIDWGGSNVLMHLLIVLVLKFVSTTVVLALPLPMGSVAPAFVLGAILGRGVGNLLKTVCDAHPHFCGESKFQDEFLPRLAMIGASAFVAGSMQSFAQVIVVFERTCLPDMLLPLCASALTAIFAAQCISKNFFDSVIEMKRLPHLPALGQGREACVAEQIMRRDFPVLPIGAGPDAIATARLRYPDWHFEVPVVDVPEVNTNVFECPEEVRREHRYVVMLVLPSFPSMSEADLRAAAASMRSVQDKARFLLKDARSPVLVPHTTPLKALLGMLTSLEKSTAFVTQNGYLIGAVTMADLYSFACGQKVVETAPAQWSSEESVNMTLSLPPLRPHGLGPSFPTSFPRSPSPAQTPGRGSIEMHPFLSSQGLPSSLPPPPPRSTPHSQ